MRADLTRSTFRPEKHYSGVRMQQGRVQLDADWNEHVDIGTHLDSTTRTDVIGRCGAPQGNAGFGIEVAPGGGDLLVSAGRMYVDGILCEADSSPIAVSAVDTGKATLGALGADGRELRAGDWIAFSATGVGPFVTKLATTGPAARTVTLDAAHELTAGDVAALTGAGSVVARRVTSYLTQPQLPDPEAALDQGDGPYVVYLDVWQRHVTALEDGDIREVALGGADTATRTQTVAQVKVARLDDEDTTCASVPPLGSFRPDSSGGLRARAQPETTAADLCTIPPGAGFRRLENQLYRVEIHDGGGLGGAATFKWSRENGSVVVPCLGVTGDKLRVSSLGRDEVLGFAAGDWIELTDDTHELTGVPGTLIKLKPPENDDLVVDTTSFSGPLDLADFPGHPRVRRWDERQAASGLRKVELAADNNGWLRLEDGVEIRFEPGRYNTGDYWLIPARTAGGDVEWPEDSTGRPLARPAEGIAHHYCALALVQLGPSGWSFREDCRRRFPPLTEIEPGRADPGIHVVNVRTRGRNPLRNDSDVTVRDLAGGIEVVCDGDVEPATVGGRPTCLVTLDLPFPVGPDQQVWGGAVVGTTPVTLDAVVTATGDTIRWEPGGVTRRWLLAQLVRVMRQLRLERLLVHLTLKGNFVYGAGDPELNVDGEAFGIVREGLLDVALPSGDTRRGGDLELWFWLTGVRPTTTRVVLASHLKSRVLTSGARRLAVPQAISLVADREAVAASLPPGYEVDTAAPIDPVRARVLIGRIRVPGAIRTVVEEPLLPLVKQLIGLLGEHRIPLELDPVAVPDPVSSFDELVGTDQGVDLVVAGVDTMERLDAARPDAFGERERAVL
jgi:hypothetical protein